MLVISVGLRSLPLSEVDEGWLAGQQVDWSRVPRTRLLETVADAVHAASSVMPSPLNIAAQACINAKFGPRVQDVNPSHSGLCHRNCSAQWMRKGKVTHNQLVSALLQVRAWDLDPRVSGVLVLAIVCRSGAHASVLLAWLVRVALGAHAPHLCSAWIAATPANVRSIGVGHASLGAPNRCNGC